VLIDVALAQRNFRRSEVAIGSVHVTGQKAVAAASTAYLSHLGSFSLADPQDLQVTLH
jgi:hypothetical protein